MSPVRELIGISMVAMLVGPGCNRDASSAPSSTPAPISEEACQQVLRHVIEVVVVNSPHAKDLPPEQQAEIARRIGEKAGPEQIGRCVARYSQANVKCLNQATTEEQVTGCKAPDLSALGPEGPKARVAATEKECQEIVQHSLEVIVATTFREQGGPPEFAPEVVRRAREGMGQGMIRRCIEVFNQENLDCVRKATTDERLFVCGLGKVTEPRPHDATITDAGGPASDARDVNPSDQRSLGDSYSPAELDAADPARLRLLRNGIYARHGHSFDAPDLREYFGRQAWYRERPGHKVGETELSPEEMTALARIRALEKNPIRPAQRNR